MTARVTEDEIDAAEAKVRELHLRQALDDLQEYGAFTRSEAKAVERWVASKKQLPPDDLVPLLARLVDVERASRIIINGAARYYLQHCEVGAE